MMYVPVYEKDTPNKGKGVFASEFIPKGTLIWKLTETKKFTKEEWKKLPYEITKDAYPDSDGNFVAAVGKGESWNHSCDANTWWTADDELSARRDIQKDEELTYDYATSDVDETRGTDEAYDWECKCGSKNCRKVLHWNDILKPEIYNIYKGHLPSWVEKFVTENNLKKVTVKNSEIQGQGVYAICDIKKGEEVLEIDDTHVVTDPKQLTNEEYESHCDYFDNKVVLMQSPEVFINHSCDPNTYIKTINGTRKVLAMRNIKTGDEITYDYSINGDNDGTFDCSCGSKNCRGVYQGNFFKLPKDIQLKYLPYLDDWFVRRHKKSIEKIGMTIREIVAVIVLNNENKLLITKRSSSREVHANIWNLPSGGIEKEESIEEAAKREVFEETGIKLDSIAIGMSLFVKVDIKLGLFVTYMLSKTNSTDVNLNSESTEYKWVTPIEALDYEFAISKEQVKMVLQQLKLL